MKLNKGRIDFEVGDHVRYKAHGWLGRVEAVHGMTARNLIEVRWEGYRGSPPSNTMPADHFDYLTERDYLVLLAAWSLGVQV